MKLLDWYKDWHDFYYSCKSCETLREQLSIANEEKRQLLVTLQSYHKKPEAEVPLEPTEQRPIGRKIPWKVQRELMEAEDREKARILNTVDKTNEELEEILGIKEDAS